MYKINLTREEIDKLGLVFNEAVKSVGLTNTDIVRFTLSIMDRCTVAILEGDKQKKEQEAKKVMEDLEPPKGIVKPKKK